MENSYYDSNNIWNEVIWKRIGIVNQGRLINSVSYVGGDQVKYFRSKTWSRETNKVSCVPVEAFLINLLSTPQDYEDRLLEALKLLSSNNRLLSAKY